MAYDLRLTGVFVELEGQAALRRAWKEWEAQRAYERDIEQLVKAQQEAEGLTTRQKAERDVMVYLRLTQQQKKAEQDGAKVRDDRRDLG